MQACPRRRGPLWSSAYSPGQAKRGKLSKREEIKRGHKGRCPRARAKLIHFLVFEEGFKGLFMEKFKARM
ncbi:hypothetical protein TCARB_1025 [Thermofilum adornatum 1505]|uniref:Uncharacterized protein n=1 Tax=Thermofilum adornatum 1505 TaxID=697581 RepID=A0A3G1A782_9CREN|nr:hypothetical protein TCARB_1025 [Thermofilum adornatum 1505]